MYSGYFCFKLHRKFDNIAIVKSTHFPDQMYADSHELHPGFLGKSDLYGAVWPKCHFETGFIYGPQNDVNWCEGSEWIVFVVDKPSPSHFAPIRPRLHPSDSVSQVCFDVLGPIDERVQKWYLGFVLTIVVYWVLEWVAWVLWPKWHARVKNPFHL